MDEMLDRLVYKNEASGLTYVAEIRKCAPAPALLRACAACVHRRREA